MIGLSLKRYVLFVFFILLTCILNAENFRFTYIEGEKYRILSTVQESVFINGGFSHKAEILNKISIHIQETNNESGLLSADFQTSERALGDQNLFHWARSYPSVFWRGPLGEYDIAPEYFMPVVRNVPRFPDRALFPGDTWAAEGSEVHDLRANFGIEDAFHFPIRVNYTYVGEAEYEQKLFDLIKISYTVFFKPDKRYSGASMYPVRISGFSEQKLYWDKMRGRPYAYSEEFDFIFILSTGESVEYIGTAEAKVIESSIMDKDLIIQDIREELDNAGLENTEVFPDELGVTINMDNIQFHPDSAIMLIGEEEKLENIGRILKQYPERDILITGHTALAGSEAGRQRLSEERARVVGEYLLGQGVRTEEQMVFRGLGAKDPIADNSTESGKQKNRRVEITILEN
jgi:outer membrane protein OmpA-like peptidoglycan-associated protein